MVDEAIVVTILKRHLGDFISFKDVIIDTQLKI